MAIRADRAAVRNVLVDVLRTGVPAVGGRIYRSRVWPISPDHGASLVELPALLVFATPEAKTRDHAYASVDKFFKTTCDMVVIARAYPPDGGPLPAEERLEAALEALAGQIEAAVLSSHALFGHVGAVEDVAEVRTELVIEPGNGSLAGSAVLTFQLEWTEPWPLPLPEACEDPLITLAPAQPA